MVGVENWYVFVPFGDFPCGSSWDVSRKDKSGLFGAAAVRDDPQVGNASNRRIRAVLTTTTGK